MCLVFRGELYDMGHFCADISFHTYAGTRAAAAECVHLCCVLTLLRGLAAQRRLHIGQMLQPILQTAVDRAQTVLAERIAAPRIVLAVALVAHHRLAL